MYNPTGNLCYPESERMALLKVFTNNAFKPLLCPEQEKAEEKQRMLSFHMRIDSEEQKRKAICKPFRKLLGFADRQSPRRTSRKYPKGPHHAGK